MGHCYEEVILLACCKTTHALFESGWAMKAFEIKKRSGEENFTQNLPHGFLKKELSIQGRENKKSGLGTSP